ncbi:Spy/CpxP family protein refolding chaperone [Bradyrhizobium australiense]|uniref:Spy/CpxP family protein refolding chaperone n=1 Tax=Bradyrhizobium australiense TaxID=2721161 RepID=A0A7Y4GPZ5_9BRAD|nr:Spy/CpxP family protein refolding chaperone [Bradyrhizobium australiense]NOJ39858.1 Spy/CpxP family protein refolding chaperone [Bradyrhizobium australiense]
MSKITLAIAAIVFATALCVADFAIAKGGHGGGHGGGRGGGHHGGGHRGGGHGHHFGGRHHGGHFHGRAAHFRSFSTHRSFSAHRMNFAASGRALNSRALARSYRHTAALHSPAMRASVTAGAALAGWQYGRGRGGGWWRHGNGGYGWVGPLFWPFAYYDLYDYTLWGPSVGAPFWYYGYDDIYAGLFGPYDYEGLTGYLPPRGSPGAGSDRLALLCGEDSREIAGLPIYLIAQTIDPTEAQRAALDDLANASVTAAQKIKAACPTSIALTASGRLASMQQRIEAMIAGVATVQPALDKFYGLLNDEQKARLNAVAEEQERKAERRGRRSLVRACDVTQSSSLRWPTEEIEARLRPTDVQRTGLTALQNASTKASEMLSASCRAEEAATPSARLAAAGKRLDVMLQAVKQVRTALDDFYVTLNDEQKAQFEAIGPRRTSFADRADTTRRYGRR